jgi:Fe-S cluster assembly protein SufB
MSRSAEQIDTLLKREYKAGFITDVEADSVPPGLNEDIIRLISAKKNEPEFMREWRLKAYRHWLTMATPTWAHVHYPRLIIRPSFITPRPRPGRWAQKSR